MKWLFLLAAVYVIFLSKAPHQCDVITLQQCTNEEIKAIHQLETKSKGELHLLLEMEATETELINQRYVESLSFIMKEIKMMEEKIELLISLYTEQTLSHHEKISNLKKEYSGDLTRRILDTKSFT